MASYVRTSMSLNMSPVSFVDEFKDIITCKPSHDTVQKLLGLVKPRLRWVHTNRLEVGELLYKGNVSTRILTLLQFLQQEPNQDQVKDIKSNLYCVLFNLVGVCENLATQLTGSRVPEVIGQDVARLQSTYRTDQATKDIVRRGLSFICNCARHPSLCQPLKEQTLKEVMGFVDPTVNDLDRVLDALVIAELINPDNKLGEYFYPDAFFATLSDLIHRSYFSDMDGYFMVNYKTDNTGTYVGMSQVMVCLKVLCRAVHLQCLTLTMFQDHEAKIEQLLTRGHPDYDRSRTNDVLQILSQHNCTKCIGGQLAIALLLKCGLTLKDGHIPSLEIQHDKMLPPLGISTRFKGITHTLTAAELKLAVGAPRGGCQYFQACRRYLLSLKVPDGAIESKYDRCFCRDCMTARGDSPVYERGKPPKVYAVPQGWAKFALRTPPRADFMDIFDQWNVAYHGTRASSLVKILKTGELIVPGDVMLSGTLLHTPTGHFNKDWRPADWNTLDLRQVFLSPSIKYASVEAYAPKASFEDKEAGLKAFGRVVFQVRVKSDSFKVGPETMGLGGHKFDPYVGNHELEWSTPNRGAIILTGILIKLESE